ncbi:hypothetical protein F0562_023673 [Nyssa sinensis]|uniref:Uncharacterized protein n=1 Tax=Nyssa sinensis TaxID=561372 RepID=A0A5J5BN08_9ASTE|nr:hypothetical protein F0562_023673 [Nyssa sinensis]
MNNVSAEYFNSKNGLRCIRFPPKIHSIGFWNNEDPFQYSVPVAELQMVVIFVLTQLLHFPLKRFGIPSLFSEIMAGIILGPTLPNNVRDHTRKVCPDTSQEIIGTLSIFGYTLFVFLMGVKTDMGMILKTGKKAFAIGVLSLIAPFVVGSAFTNILVKNPIVQKNASAKNLVFVVEAHALTSFPVVALLLKDLKILNSELGRLALSSAIISELLSVSLTMVMAIFKVYTDHQSLSRAIVNLGLCVCFLLFILIIRPAMVWMVKQTPEGRPVKDSYIYFIILVVLLSGVFTHWIEQGVLFGPFSIGLAVPAGTSLGYTLVDKLDSFVFGLLLPLFMTLIASRTNLNAINLLHPFAITNIILIIVTFLAKVSACMLAARFCELPFKDALALGLIMSAKGVVDMAFYNFFRDNQVIDRQSFTLSVIATALATVAVPICVRKLYDPSRKYAGYQKRNILHSKHDSVLHIVACIHNPHNTAAIINLLDLSGPTTERPVMIHLLHLIELRGRTSPIFISHQIQKKTVSNRSYSEDVILAFSRYEKHHQGAVMAQAFTAISPREFMHEDICTLALNKLAALVVIPFHLKWAIDGSVISEDQALRTLNCKILDRAPCSVGILLDRGHQGRSTTEESAKSSYSVVTVFFGGKDDREALTYAKRAVKNSSISLTVVRCMAMEDESLNEEEKRLDDIVLDDVKLNNSGRENFFYMEVVMSNGCETSLLVRTMLDEFDLIIVGRRHNVECPQTSGLKEFSEFPELGVVGDLIASWERKGKACVLVIQQQEHII